MTMTEARNETSSTEAMESNAKDPAASGGRHRHYGLLTVALVAAVGLIAALVIWSSNSSSSDESPSGPAPTTQVQDPGPDETFHVGGSVRVQ